MTTRSKPSTSLRQALPLHLVALAVLAPLLAAPALAQDSSYYYFGLGAGQTRGSVDGLRISESVTAPIAGGFGSHAITTDRRDTGYKVFLGYQMNPWLGTELGYFNLGRQRFTDTTVPAGTLHGQLRSQGVNLDLVGSLPITRNLTALARAGVAYARTRDEFQGTGAVVVTNPTPSDRSANLKMGVGLQYAFNDSVMVRGEAERYRNSDAVDGHGRVNLFSVSLVFPFGRAPQASPRAAYSAPPAMPMAAAPAPTPAAAPVVVAAAPMPAPLPAPLPAPAAARRVSYSAESMFGFDASAIQPAGRAALDGFAAELAGTTYDSITVEGHTDRLGSSGYNQTLSQQRADAVKAYLVSSARIDPARIQAVGLSEARPVTAADACKGHQATTALKACLQPDRRVEIEVTGTR